MRLALPIQYLRMWLLSILFCIFLLSKSSESQAFTVTSSVVWPVDTTNSVYTASDVIFTWSGQNISLGKTTLYSSNWSISGTRPTEIIHSEKYGSLWFCRIVGLVLPTTTASGSTGLIHCPSYNNFILVGGQLIPWPTGATWATGTDGSSAYEIAVAFGFTGTVTEWLNALKWEQGATWSVVFTWFTIQTDFWSGGSLSLSGTIDNDAELSGSGIYLPIIKKNSWAYYIDIYSIMWLLFFLIIFFWILRFTIFK